MSETLELEQKLRALTDENLYLERRLEVMMISNRALQTIRSRGQAENFKMVRN
jgi:hypothetical protein